MQEQACTRSCSRLGTPWERPHYILTFLGSYAVPYHILNKTQAPRPENQSSYLPLFSHLLCFPQVRRSSLPALHYSTSPNPHPQSCHLLQGAYPDCKRGLSVVKETGHKLPSSATNPESLSWNLKPNHLLQRTPGPAMGWSEVERNVYAHTCTYTCSRWEKRKAGAARGEQGLDVSPQTNYSGINMSLCFGLR